MNLELKLPKNEIVELNIGKPIVILGANGSGKTRLSVKIEELNDQGFSRRHNSRLDHSISVQRITAQKSLSISEDIVIKSLDVAKQEAIIGSSSPHSNKVGHRYQNNPATSLLNDYDKILSLFFAKNNKLMEQYYHECNIAHSKNKELPKPNKSLITKAKEIWSYLLPKRQLDLSENQVNIRFDGGTYHGKEMSDGERIILYMIVQALSVDSNSLLIIDEPELHIHKAITNKLWDKLEEVRSDCVFMYITHDLDFAVSRSISEVLWVKSYKGNEDWDYEFLPLSDYSDFPETLLFEMLGTQKKIIFVEGTKDSLDYLLYQELYKDLDYHIIPCGSCSQVINYVKAKNGYSKFNYLEVYGIIDRDFRPENEINALEQDGIFTLDVAEVENLFIVPGILEYIKNILKKDDCVVNEVKDFIINLFNRVKQNQILSAFTSEVNHQLKTLNLEDGIDSRSVKQRIQEKLSMDKIDSIFNEREEVYSDITTYEDVLRVFNFKELSDKISPKFGLLKGEYRKLIINSLKRPSNIEVKEKIISSIKPFIPDI